MTKIKPYNKPNLFILGAAKSGTTSLYYYLKQHSKIFMSPTKEPTFFCEDYQLIDNPIKYFELFENVKDEIYLGEASHGYLSDPKVPRLMKALFPDVKFIVTFRNPADRAYSLFQHMRRNGFEKTTTFERALEKEKSRINSEHFRKSNPQYFHNFLYFNSGLYGSQIERYLSLFDKDQFIFLTLDDIKNNFELTMNKICDFLELDHFDSLEPEVFNKGYTTKNFFLDRLLYNRISRKLRIDKMFGSLTRGKLTKIQASTKDQLLELYKEDQQLLFKLTGIKFN